MAEHCLPSKPLPLYPMCIRPLQPTPPPVSVQALPPETASPRRWYEGYRVRLRFRVRLGLGLGLGLGLRLRLRLRLRLQLRVRVRLRLG